MRAHGLVHSPACLVGITTLFLSACGGNTSLGYGTGSSSGGSGGSALIGTFFGYSGNSTRSIPGHSTADLVFGLADANGHGFMADMQSTLGSDAIFALQPASNNGSVSGFFNAYAANGSNLGDGSTLGSGTLSGTVAQLKLAYTSNFSNGANIIVDSPVLTPVAASVVAGGSGSATYKGGSGISGTAAIASTALSSSSTDVYTVGFTASSTSNFTLTSVSGCSFAGSATPDSSYDIFHLTVSGSCPGNSSIVLSGLASYLPAKGHSPLGGTLSTDTLIVELDDSTTATSAGTKYALALIASRQ